MKLAALKSTSLLAAIAVMAAGCGATAHRPNPVVPAPASLVGAAGGDGVADAQGTTGVAGAKGQPLFSLMGMTGPVGRTGATGAADGEILWVLGRVGPDAAVGATVGQAPGAWSMQAEYWFEANRSDIQPADTAKAAVIADYLSRYPGQAVAIDGQLDAKTTPLEDRRVESVRKALILAGVAPAKIRIGNFGDPQLQRDRRVEVLVGSP